MKYFPSRISLKNFVFTENIKVFYYKNKIIRLMKKKKKKWSYYLGNGCFPPVYYETYSHYPMALSGIHAMIIHTIICGPLNTTDTFIIKSLSVCAMQIRRIN